MTVMIQGRVDRKEGRGVGVGATARVRWGGGKWGGEMGRGATGKERQGWGNGEG